MRIGLALADLLAVTRKRDEAKAQTDYTDMDFLTDLTSYLVEGDQVDRPAAFGTAYELSRTAQELTRMSDKVLRTPEKGSLQYQDPSIPKKAVDMLGDVLCCLVHDRSWVASKCGTVDDYQCALHFSRSRAVWHAPWLQGRLVP